MSAVCEGLRVIDFTTWMAGPLATMVLADNGADVIKIEPPGGDPARVLPAFQTWNRGKQSVVLDLKTDAGRARAGELIAGADVVVASFRPGGAGRPGAAGRLGIAYDRVHELNPRAVYASISGYGESGRSANLPGYEAFVAAKSGRMMMFESIADRPGPAYPAVPVASFAAAMFTVQGILAALRTRRLTGLGQHVTVSLLASLMPYDMVMWIAPQLSALDDKTATGAASKGVYNTPLTTNVSGTQQGDASRAYNPRQVHRPEFRVPRPNYLPAVTKDGVWLQFANTADHLWLAQMEALGLTDLYGEERFAKMPSVTNERDSEALWEIVLDRVRSRSYAEWARMFDEHRDVAVDRFLSPIEAIAHRQVAYNGHIVDVPGLDGSPTRQPGSLVRYSQSELRIGEPAPRLDEHRDELVCEVPRPPSLGEGEVEDSPWRGPEVREGPAADGPLAGVTMLDFATFFAAPYATSILANLGARVIKIETLGGDYSRYSAGGLLAFPTTQGKESVALDLKRDEGRAIVRKLIERADALLHNFRPGVPERLGIDAETCLALNPRLVYLYGASYGDGGPDASRPAFHPIAGAIAGNAVRQAGAGRPLADAATLPIDDLKREAWRMLRANEANPDVNAAIAAATALLLGLYARDQTGEGQSLMTTMIASNMYANSDELIDYEGRPPVRTPDADLYGLGPLYRLYETDAGWVFLACLQRKEWEAFCAMIEQLKLASRWHDAWSMDGAAPGLAAALEALFRTRAADEWERLAIEHDVPLVAVESRDPGRFCLEDEDMRAQGYMAQVHSASYGTYWRHGSPHQFSAHTLTYGPWEPVGGHTRAILAELGYGEVEIARLISDRVVEAAEA
jgi:crotonobetainyl-CoA:carnitine CoA-transferase CaiB-like acyl-CoA transferase